MKRILAAVSFAAIAGLATSGAALAGGMPDNGYPNSSVDSNRPQPSHVGSQPKAGNGTTVGMTDRMEENDTAMTTTYHGHKVVHAYPQANIDGNRVQPGHIGTQARADNGTDVADLGKRDHTDQFKDLR